MVTNARESSPTTGADPTPVEAPRATPAPSHDTATMAQGAPRTVALAMVRAILSTLSADTAAALVALLVSWFRAIIGAELHTVDAANVVTDDAVQGAADIGAEEHARAIVAVFMVDGMHDTARAALAADMGPMVRAMAREALDVLGALEPRPTPPKPPAAIVRAILATLAPDTAAALLVLLVQWLRGVLAITGATPEARQHAAELSADRVTENAAQLGARPHAVAIVAALVGLAPAEAVDGLYCEPFNPCMPTELREALDVLGAIDADALAAPHPATASGLAGARGARVLRASLSSARGIATRALMNAAADADDAPAALAAVYMHRDDGASSVHTLVATLTAVCEASRLVGAAADGVRGDITTTHGDECARRIAGCALGMMGPCLDALTAAVDVLRALDSEGGR